MSVTNSEKIDDRSFTDSNHISQLYCNQDREPFQRVDLVWLLLVIRVKAKKDCGLNWRVGLVG